jgi:hypothetical protein
MTWFTPIGFQSIGEIHSLKVMGNSSVDSTDLFPLNYDNFSNWFEANRCKSSHWTLWCQNICLVMSTFFGKLVYWIIPTISKTVYKNIIDSLFKLPINSVYILRMRTRYRPCDRVIKKIIERKKGKTRF